MMAFGLLMGLCIELIGVGCKQVVYWDVLKFVAYGFKGIQELIVTNVDVKTMILGMDRSVIGCLKFREVKEIVSHIVVD